MSHDGTNRFSGRPRDLAWDNVTVYGGVVTCNDCEKIIHTMGHTHVERVRHHLVKRCVKRLRPARIDTFFPFNLAPEDETLLSQWVFETGMASEIVAHPTLDAPLKALHPSASAPSVWTMKARHLDAAYAASLDKIKAALSGKPCTLTTDGWTDVNGKSGINYMAVA
jgi:hypothetical protein